MLQRNTLTVKFKGVRKRRFIHAFGYVARASHKDRELVVWKQIASEHCNLNEIILDKALELEKIGFRSKDALHIACAIFVKSDFFISTDKKILNKNVTGINLVNPIKFVEEFLYDK